MENKEYSVFDIADWFLSKESMTPKKLQKMVYYAYSWGLVFFNDNPEKLDHKLFNSKFEAWVHGPVIPELYAEYARYGYQTIPEKEANNIKNPDVENLLNQIWNSYGGYNGNELESITHQESPWINARNGYGVLDKCKENISDKDIYSCYGSR